MLFCAEGIRVKWNLRHVCIRRTDQNSQRKEKSSLHGLGENCVASISHVGFHRIEPSGRHYALFLNCVCWPGNPPIKCVNNNSL